MANVKITELPTDAAPATTDLVPFVDVDADRTEAATVADLVAAGAAGVYQPLAAVLTGTTASYTTAEASKLAGIEALADVTDATNVAAAGGLLSSDIGTTVQGYDVDTLKADTADTLTAGFDSSDYAAGTKSTGTYTPAASDGNFQVATNGGAHTLAPPSTSCSIVIHYTNNGSAGTITTSGFTAVTGDDFTTTDTHEFVCVVTKINDVSVLNVTALQ